MRTVKQKFPNFYGDVAITKLKDHFITASAYNATELSSAHVFNDMQVILMNANANGGDLLSGLGATIATFQPLNFDSLEQRYSQCRPMGAKITFRISLPDDGNTATGNRPLVFACFPYQNQGTQYGNYWNQTNVPAMNFNADSIGQMKYGAVRRLYGEGSKPVLTFTRYFDFAKIVGRTREQYQADPNMQYDAATTNAPTCQIKLACVISDMIAGTQRTYNPELTIVQYVRMEAAKLNPS